MQRVVLAGTFEHTIDDKGRVTLPAKYRDHFEELAILARMPGKERAVRVYTREGWESFEERNIERLDEFNNAEDRRLQRAIFANLSPVTPDKQGRVLVPASFVEALGLTGKVLIVGNRTHLEIWDPESYGQDSGLSGEDDDGA